MLKVKMIIAQYYPIIGGAEHQAELLSEALLRAGVDVKVYTRLPLCTQMPDVEKIPVKR